MCLFQFGGVMLGYSINAWILRSRLGWSWDAISESGLCPRILAQWLERREIRTKGFKQLPGGVDPLYDPQLDHLV
jgi:hypothetical protein